MQSVVNMLKMPLKIKTWINVPNVWKLVTLKGITGLNAYIYQASTRVSVFFGVGNFLALIP